ncbi:MAG TPA: translation initiation factor IF-3 [Candidatus Saccharimonadales bacterium]|nr:translation initiation factor IF-3 [Candidatus Saccharimonadales bacterium]
MIRRGYKKQQERRVFYRTNERIMANSLRVLDGEGKQIGLLSRQEALEKARELELDLVEIAPNAKPPVAKIIDYNKFLYQQAKKKQEEKRKTKVTETKEVRLGPFMQGHDLDVMTGRARGFLEDSDKVRLVVKFNGRQITRPEFGRQVLQKVVQSLSDISKIEKEPRLEGRQLVTILAPERKTNAKEKDKEISQPTI